MKIGSTEMNLPHGTFAVIPRGAPHIITHRSGSIMLVVSILTGPPCTSAGEVRLARMRYRTFGRTGWQVSDVGYGMWGMAGWSGSDDQESHASLDQAIALGCNFFDTAWAYGDGRSERILGETLKRHAGKTALRRDQDPAEEPPVAGTPRASARGRLSRRLHPRVHREEPHQHRGVVARPPAVPRLERRVGGRPGVAARGAGAQGRRAGQGVRDQRQSVRAGQRAARRSTPV